MSLITDFVLGALREMAPPEWKDWLEAEKAGGATVRFIKGMLESGEIKTPAGEAALRQKLEEEPDKGEKIMNTILKAPASESDSLLPRYVQILNIVVAALKRNRRPIVTKGFLHSPTTVTYWHFPDGKIDGVHEFAVAEGERSIDAGYPSELAIYFLNNEVTAEELDEWNLLIRTTQKHELPEEKYEQSFKISSIEEFQINGAWPKQMFKPPFAPISIPFGLPGVAAMLLSVDRALLKQRFPFRAAQDATDPFIPNPP